MRFWRNKRGFTLTEVVITLSVLGAVTAIAIPTFAESQQNARLNSKANELASLLQLAQSESLKLQQDLKIVYKSDQQNKSACIGVTFDETSFTCSEQSSGLPKLEIATDDTFSFKTLSNNKLVDIPSGSLLTISHVTSSPSVDKTIVIQHKTDAEKIAGALVRRYIGVNPCSNANWQGWQSCT